MTQATAILKRSTLKAFSENRKQAQNGEGEKAEQIFESTGQWDSVLQSHYHGCQKVTKCFEKEFRHREYCRVYGTGRTCIFLQHEVQKRIKNYC